MGAVGRAAVRRPRARIEAGVSDRWAAGTAMALLAVACIFVDSLLMVQAQDVSIEADSLRKELKRVSMELGALESQWAAATSHVELVARAERIGLVCPDHGQVVLLPASFLEEAAADRSPTRESLRKTFLDAWIRLRAAGIP